MFLFTELAQCDPLSIAISSDFVKETVELYL